jgi:hypothetical protein
LSFQANTQEDYGEADADPGRAITGTNSGGGAMSVADDDGVLSDPVLFPINSRYMFFYNI